MSLYSRVRAWRRERLRALALEAVIRLACGTSAAAGALALLDRAASLPRPLRLAALALWACWAAWTLARRLCSPWRALGWEQVLAAAAAKWPETRLVLSSAWGLRAGAAGPGVSEELRAEHLARADRMAENLPDEPLEAWSPSRGARRLAAAAGVLLLVNAAAGDLASWARVVAPWRDAALERWVEVSPGDARLDWGGPASVSARLKAGGVQRGLRAADLVLETRGGGGAWRATDWTRTGVGETLWTCESLSAPLDYRLRWRDLAGRAYRLEPVPPPRWRRAVAEVRGLRGTRRFVLGTDAAVLARRGDWVSVEGEPDGPLESARLLLSGRPSLPMRREGGVWRTGFSAEEEATFTFSLVGGDGRRDSSPPVYALSVAADAPPKAELLSPQTPLVASPEDSILIAYEARDDGAVASAALVVRVPGRPDGVFSLPVPAPPRDEALGDFSWSLEGLRPGERAQFWIEATDDASPPQTARSEKGSVEVVDAAADHRAALAAREASSAALERAAARAEAARDASARGDLAASRSETGALASEWQSASRALAEWAARAAADPRGEPGLADEAARAAGEFERAGSEGLPAVEKALAGGDAGKAGREQAALAEQARGVQRSVREGADAQSLSDMAAGVEGARREGESLARAAESLASRGKDGTVSAAELEELERQLAQVDEALESLRRKIRALPQAPPDAPASQARELPLDAARTAANDLRRALASGDVAGAAAAAKRLAEQLGEIGKALEAAGRSAADERGRRERTAADGVERSWRETVEAQTGAVEAARALEESHEARVLASQKSLLSDLEREQETLLSSAAAHPGLWPEGARRSAAEVARQFREGAVTDAPARLQSITTLLRAAGASRPADAEELRAFAAAEASLAERLAAGAPAPALDVAGALGAAQAQARARRRAEDLRAEIGRAARDMGFLSGRLAGRVDEAVSEQDRGERALRRGDWPEGLKRAEAALAILQEGGEQARSSASGAGPGGGAAQGESGGASFMRGSVRAALRGASGSGLGRVRLPSAEEYRPPRELREELERSLREPRPAAHSPEIKEYFKRLAR